MQLQFGQIDIGQITFDPRSRDDIPQLLRGLQYIYTTPAVREEVFRILLETMAQQVNVRNGRPGLDLWKVLVMGTLRLYLNWDYDRLLDQVNHHRLIRQMLGHGLLDDELPYKLQTLKDNVGLLTVEALDRINQVVVQAGHVVLKKTRSTLTAGAPHAGWWRRMCTIQRTSTCCGTPHAGQGSGVNGDTGGRSGPGGVAETQVLVAGAEAAVSGGAAGEAVHGDGPGKESAAGGCRAGGA